MTERKTIHGNVTTDGRFDAFTPEIDIRLLREANNVGYRAREAGDEPFGCILADENAQVLLEGLCRVVRDKDPTAHGEMMLIRAAVLKYTPKYLWRCSAYVSGSPCAMCTGALFWANIGRIVYATQIYGDTNRSQLAQAGASMIGDDFLRILATGNKEIVIDGPYPELQDEIMQRFAGYQFDAT
jgi:tRNA(Arg) A34 adenosine deaminase TadA